MADARLEVARPPNYWPSCSPASTLHLTLILALLQPVSAPYFTHDNHSVQPVGGSLEVDKQFLNAIEGSSKSLVNSSTISPSRVLDDKSKFFNNQKPDTTISHIINAKEFFSHFPIKNFTYVDEQGTSSLSDSTKPEDPGIGVVKIVQPLESTSAVLEDDSTSHIVDSKHESEVEDVRKIAGEVDSLDKVKEAQEKEREEQGGKETMQAETKTDAAIDSDTTDEDGADEQEQENIDQPTADTISTAEVEKLSPIDAQSKSVDEPEQLTIIGGEEEEIKEEEIQQVEDVTSKPEINKEDISDSKRTNESTMEEKVEPTGDEKKDVEAKETTEEPPTRPEEQTPSVPDTEGEEVDQPSEPTEESEKHKKKVNETEKAVKEETQTEVDRTPEGEAEKESEKEVEKKEAEKETKVDDEVEKKEAEKETEKKEPVKEDEKKESKDEESEKSADILETYSQFTQRVNAEKKNDIITNGHGNNGHGKGPKVKSKNYASPDCGSKLLTVNPEATHASKVIHANKDEYMLNKCRDKIWFTIDLCESIRPQKFDIANFELFSNLPRDLVVSGSHRYPTREWTPLAKVTGQEGNRGVQSFSIDTEDFFKYIKVEVLNHYGSEFYCPISLFRIYGLSEFEVIDTIEDSSDDHDDSEDTEALEEQDKKKVKEESKPSGIPAVLKNMLSGVLDVIKRGYRPSTSVTDPVDTCFSLNPKNAVAEHRCHLAQSLNYILSCYRTEYQDLMQKPVVSLTVKNSSFCHLLASSMCLYPEVDDSIVYDTVCNNSYICVMLSPKHVLAMCFMHDNKIMDGEVACDSARTHLPENFSATTADIISPENAIPAYVKNAKINTSSITRADAMDTTADGDPHSIKLQYKTRGTMAAEQELAKAEDTTIPRVSETPPTPKTPQKSSKACVNGDKDKQLKEPAREDNTTQPEVVPEADESGLGGLDLEAEEKEKEKEEEEFQQGEELVIPPPAPTTTTPPPPPPPPPAQAEPKVSSTSPTNKESVVVRLSNKIKALEYNMSISSQYLEELSRRYKRQMEEMQKQFNMTIAALNATSHQAFQRDQHHQRDIEALEEQLASATEALASLIASRETLANTVVEQHLLLMAVEVVLLCLVFTLCHRRSPHYHATATHARAQTPSEDGTENGVMSRREGGGCCDGERGRVRRRSVDSITRARSSAQHVRQRRPSVEALRISGTYQDLLIIEPAIPIMVDPVSDRKRKKKSSSGTLKRSKSNTSIVEKKTSCSTRRARRIENLDMSSAGVLFCGDQVETKGSPTQPSHSPHSPHSHDFSYQPFVSQEDPGCYGESGEVWSYISRVGADLEGTNEKISNPKRHSIASFHNCESSVVKKGSRLSKSLSLSATSEKFQGGTEKIKKHRKVKKTMNGVIEDRHCDPSDTPFPVPLYNHDYYCETDGPAYNNQAEHYIEYYNRGHNVVQFSKDTNGHSSHTYNDSIVGTVRIANGDNSQVIETLSSDYIHSSYEKSVIDRRKSPSATKVKKLRSDNWEWYSAQHGAGSSSETVSTCSTDSSGKHRKPNVEDKAVEKVEERSVEKGDKKVKKKKKSKVRTSVVVLEEEGETGT